MAISRSLASGIKAAAFVGGGMAALGAATAVAAAAGGYTLWRRRNGYALAGKVVLITGGSRGLGFALASEFLGQGARVAVCARDQAELDRAQMRLGQSGEVMTIAADLRDERAAERVVGAVGERWGAVDVLVNNAGVMQVGPWSEMGEEDYRQAMDLHFWAPYRLCRAVLPAMLRQHQGRIVNIASIGGLVAVPHMLPYTASKFALVGFSQGLRSEVHRHGIRVTTVCPGLMRTGSQENIVVKGDRVREFNWFAASGSLPLVAQPARRAARRIVAACRHGEAHLVLSLPAKVAAWAHGLMPGTVTDAMALANRLLPSAPETANAVEAPPHELYTAWTSRLIRPLVARDGEQLNQPRAKSARESG